MRCRLGRRLHGHVDDGDFEGGAAERDAVQALARVLGHRGVLVRQDRHARLRATLQLELAERPKVREQLLRLGLVEGVRQAGHAQPAVGGCGGPAHRLRAVEQRLRVRVERQRQLVVLQTELQRVERREQVERRVVLEEEVVVAAISQPAEESTRLLPHQGRRVERQRIA